MHSFRCILFKTCFDELSPILQVSVFNRDNFLHRHIFFTMIFPHLKVKDEIETAMTEKSRYKTC